MQGQPITLPIYGPDDELIKTLSKQRIKDEFLERAIDVAETLKVDDDPKKSIAVINQLLADFFGVSADEIRAGCDFAEKVTALEAIIARAGVVIGQAGFPANPTQPG